MERMFLELVGKLGWTKAETGSMRRDSSRSSDCSSVPGIDEGDEGKGEDKVSEQPLNPGPVHADVNGDMPVGSMALPQSSPAAFIEAVGQRMSSLVTGAKAGRVVASSEVSRSEVTSDVEMGDGSK